MMIKIITVVMVGLIAVSVWAVWYEATFDYTECHATEKYRERHQAAWVQFQKVGDVTIPINHPARSWTERMYSCPSDDGMYDKWRNESKP